MPCVNFGNILTYDSLSIPTFLKKNFRGQYSEDGAEYMRNSEWNTELDKTKAVLDSLKLMFNYDVI